MAQLKWIVHVHPVLNYSVGVVKSIWTPRVPTLTSLYDIKAHENGKRWQM